MEDPNLSLELQRLTVTISYNVATRMLSFTEGSSEWAGTSEDNLSAQIKVEGIGDLLSEYTAELVFGIPMYHNGVIYHPIGQIDAATGTYVLPNEILASAKDGILPTELRLTKGTEVITSRNALPISVVSAIDALRPFDGAYLPEIMGRSQEWAADVQYAKGAIVIRHEVLYYSVSAGNLGNDPEDGNINEWREVSTAAHEYQEYIGNGSTTDFTITHGLHSPDIQFTVTYNGTDRTGDVTNVATVDGDTAVFTFDPAPPDGTLLRINEAFRGTSAPLRSFGAIESLEEVLAPEAFFGRLEVTDEKVSVSNGEMGINSQGRAYAGPSGSLKVLALDEDLDDHLDDTNNPHGVTADQLGLDATRDADKPISTATQTALDGKVSTNAAITTGTKCKITYDSKGLVTAGADLTDTDIPSTIERNTNKVAAWQAVPDDIKYPTEKLVKDALDLKAVDTGVVHLSGSETISGVKTFDNNVNIGTTSVPRELAIKGNLNIEGNIIQNGSTYETHAEKVLTTNDKIILRDGAVAGLASGSTAGFIAKKYDGTYDGELAIDNSGTIRVGDIGDTQPVLTRKESADLTSNGLLAWDATNFRATTRSLGANDVPNISATKITSDTLDDARIPSSVERTANKVSSFGEIPTDSNYPTEKLVKTELDKKVVANTAITGATKCKITYDAKGLVTAGADLVDSDIPSGIERKSNKKSAWQTTPTDTAYPTEKLVKTELDSKIDSAEKGVVNGVATLDAEGKVPGSQLRAAVGMEVASNKVSAWQATPTDEAYPSEKLVKDSLDSKITANSAITSATKCKITYDSKGLVTAGADLTATDIPVLDAAKITSGTFDVARIPATIERTANKTSSWQTTPDDTKYPTEKLVKDALDLKAIDSSVVHIAGNESISGIKTFENNVNVGTSSTPREITLNGNLNIKGNIVQNGTTYETHAEQVYTAKDKIITREGAVSGLAAGETTGFTAKKYDGTNDGELALDNSGTIRVGDVGDTQPVLTRRESADLSSNGLLAWDPTGLRAITRTLLAGDIPSLAASKITSETFSDARIPISIERTSNKISSWQSTPSDTAYPTEKLVKDTIDAHTGNTSNPHSVTKAQVGLSNVDNTSDTAKPISTATQTALNAKQDTLTFDNVPVSGSNNPVKSGGIYTALDGKQDGLTFDDRPKYGSNNPAKSGGIWSDLITLNNSIATKQNELTFDNVPVSGSNNPVKSGGIYTALDSKSAKIYVHDIASFPSLNYSLMVKAMIITSSSTPFNLSTLATWLYDRGYNGLGNTATSTYPAMGGYTAPEAHFIRIVYGLSSDGTTVRVHITGNSNLDVDDLTSMGDTVVGV